jgi:hypothetical protein
MKKSQKPEARDAALSAAPKPQEETPRITLRIEELEPRLTPQSTSPILE